MLEGKSSTCMQHSHVAMNVAQNISGTLKAVSTFAKLSRQSAKPARNTAPGSQMKRRPLGTRLRAKTTPTPAAIMTSMNATAVK